MTAGRADVRAVVMDGETANGGGGGAKTLCGHASVRFDRSVFHALH